MARTRDDDPNPHLRKPFSKLTEKEKQDERDEFEIGYAARREKTGIPIDEQNGPRNTTHD